MAQKILKIGSSAGITIPKKFLMKLGLSVGDTVELDEAEDSKSIVIQSTKQDNNRRERIAKLTTEFIDEYRDDLEALADK